MARKVIPIGGIVVALLTILLVGYTSYRPTAQPHTPMPVMPMTPAEAAKRQQIDVASVETQSEIDAMASALVADDPDAYGQALDRAVAAGLRGASVHGPTPLSLEIELRMEAVEQARIRAATRPTTRP